MVDFRSLACRLVHRNFRLGNIVSESGEAWRWQPIRSGGDQLMLGLLNGRTRAIRQFTGLIAAALLLCCGDAMAGTFDGVMETMMAAQGAEATLIGRLFGADPASPIQFSSNVDVTAGTFEFHALPNSQYLGQPLQLQVNGSVDEQTSLWTINSQGALGTATWTGNGAGIVAALDDPDHGEIDWAWPIGPLVLDFHLKWDWTLFESFWLSTMEAKFTVNGVVVATGEGADALGDSEWEWKLASNNSFFVDSDGNASFPDGGPGAFQMRIIPEPSAATLALAGGLALAPILARRRSRIGRSRSHG